MYRHTTQVRGERDADRAVQVAARQRQEQGIAVQPDGAALPHGGSEPLPLVGVSDVQPGLAAGESRPARSVEALTRGVEAVRVEERQVPKFGILELAGGRPAQPVSLVPVDAPVAHQGIGVNLSALPVEGIGQRAGDIGPEVTHTQHSTTALVNRNTLCQCSIAQTFYSRKSALAGSRLRPYPSTEVGGLRARTFLSIQ